MATNKSKKRSEKKPVKRMLRIWHNSKFGTAPFRAAVTTIEQAKRFLQLLADYDLYQGERVAANAQGLEVFEEEEWVEWENSEGDDITAVMAIEDDLPDLGNA